MFVKSLYLQQFRNYREIYFEFNPHLNLICGPNAQGKTTVLEAIHYLMFGRSFRPGLHQDLIRMGCNSFYLESVFCKHGIEQKLRLYVEENERKILYNSTTLPSISNLLGMIQGVVMTPDDINLIKGSPALRRQFLDLQLAQVDPLYAHHLSRYAKAMRHRNQLLKQKNIVTIETWEHEMAHAAAYIIKQRRRVVESLQVHCRAFYSYLTGEKETLTLRYLSTAATYQNEADIKTYHIQQFNKNRSREILFGHTLTGPHKDDLWIGIGEQEARFFGSEGQQRSCVAALHMGEWQSLKQIAEDVPLFMIDDVSMSLDEKRRNRLLEQLSSLGQVFLTTTDGDLANSFPGSKTIFALPFEPVLAP